MVAMKRLLAAALAIVCCLVLAPGALARAHLGSPGGLALSADGRTLYYSDLDRSRVVAFTPAGRVRAMIGQGVLRYQSGIAVAPAGTLYVADKPTGRVVAVWGHRGTGRGALEYPMGIAVGRDGLVYVADESSVQVFDPRGRFVRRVDLVDDAAPAEVAVAADGTLYVASSPSTMT